MIPVSVAGRRARVVAASVVALGAGSVLAACSDDGREMRAPTFPLPVPTTTMPAAVPTTPAGP